MHLKVTQGGFLVLTYHKVTNQLNFQNQLLYFKKKYVILTLDEVLSYIIDGKQFPENALLITFDDGDKSLYTNAFPILKKHNIPAVIFVVTDLINTNSPFWWDEIEYYLGSKEGNIKVREIKKCKNETRENYLIQLRQNSKKPSLKYPQLTTAELMEMSDAVITIANHSHTHPMFDRCTPEELEGEMKKSTAILKDLGFTPEVFAYPNGNYSKVAEQKLKEHEIKLAFLFDHKINKGKINQLRISRLSVNDDTPLWKFKFILSGWHSKILPLTKTLGKLRK